MKTKSVLLGLVGVLLGTACTSQPSQKATTAAKMPTTSTSVPLGTTTTAVAPATSTSPTAAAKIVVIMPTTATALPYSSDLFSYCVRQAKQLYIDIPAAGVGKDPVARCKQLLTVGGGATNNGAKLVDRAAVDAEIAYSRLYYTILNTPDPAPTTTTTMAPTTTTTTIPVPQMLLSMSGPGPNAPQSPAPGTVGVNNGTDTEYGFITPHSPKLKIDWTASGEASYVRVGSTLVPSAVELDVIVDGTRVAWNNPNSGGGWALQSGSVIVSTTVNKLQQVEIRTQYNCNWTVKITEVY